MKSFSPGAAALGISLQNMGGVNGQWLHITVHLQAQQHVLLVRIGLGSADRSLQEVGWQPQ